LTPSTPYGRELEGRRTYFRQEQAKIKAHRAKVRAALDSGDRKAALFLAQPGAAVSNTQSEREQRRAAFCREDDELLERVERNATRTRSEVAALQAEYAELGSSQWLFANAADEAEVSKLLSNEGSSDNGIALLRQLIADGLVIKAERQQ
jgi:hypothetical protein